MSFTGQPNSDGCGQPYGGSTPPLGDAEPDHGTTIVPHDAAGNCSLYYWNNTNNSYDLVERSYDKIDACLTKLNRSSTPDDATIIIEFVDFLDTNTSDEIHDADCETCLRSYNTNSEIGVDKGPDASYPTNVYDVTNFPDGFDEVGYSVPTRQSYANDYPLDGGSLCVRIGELGWPGPPHIGLPETYINPVNFVGAFNNKPDSDNVLRGELSPEVVRSFNIPFYASGEKGPGVINGLHASYKGEKILDWTAEDSTNGAKKVAAYPAWLRPLTDALLGDAYNGEALMPSSDGGLTTADIPPVGSNTRVGRTEWFGSWIIPETYPGDYYTNLDPGYNYPAKGFGIPIPHGPQLVGWLCGFNSPAYRVAKTQYNTANQTWRDTYHYCFDKWTCPELFKPSIIDEFGFPIAGSQSFDRGDECVEPLVPVNINTNASQETEGYGSTGMEFINGQFGRNMQTLPTYMKSSGLYTNGEAILGMCDGAMVEYHKMINHTIRELGISPQNTVSSDMDFVNNSSWNGKMRSIIPLLHQGTPFFGIQRPITATQGQLGFINGPAPFPVAVDPESPVDGFHNYAPGNFGLGGEYRYETSKTGSLRRYSIYDSPINIGSNTGRNLRGVPKTGDHVKGTKFAGGSDLASGACSTPYYSVDAGDPGDVTKEYYTCKCDSTQLDTPDNTYDALYKMREASVFTLSASNSGNIGELRVHSQVSDPRRPGICSQKHGQLPRRILQFWKGEKYKCGDFLNSETNQDIRDIGGATINPEFPDSALLRWWETPQNIYNYLMRTSWGGQINPCDVTMAQAIGNDSQYGANVGGFPSGWSQVIDKAIQASLTAASTLPQFESCCLPDGTCTNELEYARCIDQGGTPRNVSCEVPCDSSRINQVGSCCYNNPETGRPFSADNVSRSFCDRMKGTFSDRTANQRVNDREPGCCEACGGATRSSDNLTGGRFRSRANSSETDIRIRDITSFDKAQNEDIRNDLINSYKNCTLSTAHQVAAERYLDLIMNYEYEKDVACTNARVKGMDLNLVSYFNCRCNLLGERVSNLKSVFKNNVCETNDAQSDPMKTTLSVKMEESINRSTRYEDNCLPLISDDTGVTSTFEKAKGCCCKYAKDEYQIGDTRYNENDLVGCSHISKFECDRFVNFNTKWTRCLSECRDGCSSPDNPSQCTRCSDRFDGTNPVERSTTSLGNIYSGPLDYCWKNNTNYRECLRCAADRYFNNACNEYKAKHLCYVHRGNKPLGEPKQSPFCTRIGDSCGRKALPFMGCPNPDITPRSSSSSFVPQTPERTARSTSSPTPSVPQTPSGTSSSSTNNTGTSQSSSSPPQSGGGY